MRNLVLALVLIGFGVVAWPGGAAACCRYGCCDCGCVARVAQDNAGAIARSIERALRVKGAENSIRSFRIDFSDRRMTATKWTCAAVANGAVCTRR